MSLMGGTPAPPARPRSRRSRRAARRSRSRARRARARSCAALGRVARSANGARMSAIRPSSRPRPKKAWKPKIGSTTPRWTSTGPEHRVEDAERSEESAGDRQTGSLHASLLPPATARMLEHGPRSRGGEGPWPSSCQCERRGAVALLTLNRPDSLNALSTRLLDALGARIRRGRGRLCACAP